ncbi:hypothetical protein K2X30_11960 [bacterium]|jgi:hypothetical protein|nr:hypothetical protein [bacterium]
MKKLLLVSCLFIAGTAQAFENKCVITAPGSSFEGRYCSVEKNPKEAYSFAIKVDGHYEWVDNSCYSLENAISKLRATGICDQDPAQYPTIKEIYSGD